MSHDAPTAWIRLPKFETRLADQIRRNVRERKGASVEARQESVTLMTLKSLGGAMIARH
jgi:hypothetical protein